MGFLFQTDMVEFRKIGHVPFCLRGYIFINRRYVADFAL